LGFPDKLLLKPETKVMKNQINKIAAALMIGFFGSFLPNTGTAQYLAFQKKVENAPYIHCAPAGQGYVLTSAIGGIARTDEDLSILWRRTYGSAASGTQMFPIATHYLPSSDKLLLVGYGRLAAQAKFAPAMIETDASGVPVSSRLYAPAGLPLASETYLHIGTPTTDGGFLAAGQITNAPAGGPEWYLLKLSATGTVQWSRGFHSTGQERLTDVRQLPNGSYIVAFTVDDEVALAQLNAAGQSEWGRRYATGQLPLHSASVAYDQVAGGFVVVCADANGARSLLFRTNAIGDILWSREYTLPTPSACRFQTVQALSDGFLIGGTFIGSPVGLPQTRHTFMLKTDFSGDQLWNNLYTVAGSNEVASMFPATGVGMIFSGAVTGNTNQGLLARMTPDGNTGLCPGATLFFQQNAGNVANGNPIHPSPLMPVAVSFNAPVLFNLPSQALSAPAETVYCDVLVAGREAIREVFNIQVFPNPATTRATLMLEAPDSGEGVLQLFDLSGRLLYSSNIEQMESTQPIDVDLTPYLPGSYLLRAVIGERIYVSRLVKH
jgi:hypothetical protein